MEDEQGGGADLMTPVPVMVLAPAPGHRREVLVVPAGANDPADIHEVGPGPVLITIPQHRAYVVHVRDRRPDGTFADPPAPPLPVMGPARVRLETAEAAAVEAPGESEPADDADL